MATQRILITGANRGIGLAFVHQYLKRGDRVFAGCRRPETASELQKLGVVYPDLTLVALDVADAESIRKAHDRVREQADGLELLLNNAGVYSAKGSENPAESLGNFDFEAALGVLQINSVGPLIVAQAFIDLLQAGKRAKIVSISSGYGSLSANTGSFPYYYSASKAALNMLTRSLAGEVGPLGIAAVVLSPGWVRTDMGGPNASLLPEQSVASMIRVIDGLSLGDNGSFLDWQGDVQPW